MPTRRRSRQRSKSARRRYRASFPRFDSRNELYHVQRRTPELQKAHADVVNAVDGYMQLLEQNPEAHSTHPYVNLQAWVKKSKALLDELNEAMQRKG